MIGRVVGGVDGVKPVVMQLDVDGLTVAGDVEEAAVRVGEQTVGDFVVAEFASGARGSGAVASGAVDPVSGNERVWSAGADRAAVVALRIEVSNDAVFDDGKLCIHPNVHAGRGTFLNQAGVDANVVAVDEHGSAACNRTRAIGDQACDAISDTRVRYDDVIAVQLQGPSKEVQLVELDVAGV